MYRKKAHIHFVGIGGIGMSGIAKILRFQGYTISGCDLDIHKKSVRDLQAVGCHIYEGNNTPTCQQQICDILVYSSAIQENNPEVTAAQKQGIPTIPRALMLAELMRTKYSVAIAGSHGKTTTTSLASHILIESELDPTVVIGGHLKNISSNARFGSGDFLIAEADESDRSLLHLQASIAVVTNIDLEHLETYTDLADIKQTFTQFLNNLPFYGKAILCLDDAHVRSLLPLPHIKTITYGVDTPADMTAHDIALNPDHSTFNAHYKGTPLGSITLTMPGIHNVRNCLAAITLALDLGIPFQKIQKAVKSFKGIERRFSFHGSYKNTEVFDDYGHHPEEIRHTLAVARRRAHNKLIVLFQPHRYTRTAKLWDEFVAVFANSDIDTLLMTDIYAASETPLAGITTEQLIAAIHKKNPNMKVLYTPYQKEFTSIKQALSPYLGDKNLLLLLGAGNVNRLAKSLS